MLRLASWKAWLSVAVVFVGFAGAFFWSSAPFAVPTVEALCGEVPLDVRFTSTAADVDSFLEACGPEGRDAYRNMQIADFFYPLVFGLFMSSSLAAVLGRLFPRRPSIVAFAAIGLLGAAFDYVENVFVWRALWAFPGAASTNSWLGLASAAKTATFWVAGAVLLFSLIGLVGREGLRRTRRSEIDPDGLGVAASQNQDIMV